MAQYSGASRPARYLIPTHLNVEDKIISFNGVGMTMRQVFLLLIGWSTAFNIWRQFEGLAGYGMTGFVLRIGIAALPGLLSVIVALTTVSGRPLETWLMVFLRYHTTTKLYLWRSLSSRYPLSKELELEQDQGGASPSGNRGFWIPFDLEFEQEEWGEREVILA